MKTYLVGGAVRDRLLGLPVADRDWVVTGSTPEEMLRKGFIPVGKDFPVFLHPKTREEYALARTERKTARGYHGFEFYTAPDVTLEQDLLRRDLTINAMAEDETGGLVDPFNGAEDLKNRRLRHVSDAFAEDPVRLLRVARFWARFSPMGFRIADETMALMRTMVEAGEADALVPERVWQEIQRALGEAEPRRFFEALRESGAGGVVLPELDVLFGVPQPENYHPEIDTGLHCMMVLDEATRLSPDPEVRFAALIHDLGKGVTPSDRWPAHHGHEEAGRKPLKALCQRLRVPKRFQELAEIVMRFHTHCHRAESLRPDTVLRLLEQVDALRRPERFEQFLIACEADFLGRGGYAGRAYPQAGLLRKALALVRAVDITAIVDSGVTGKALGERIHQARAHALKDMKPEPE
ncbi:MAG: multifunctional CCA addition/repair protein [Gammaproteobacteria bacterium]|nr:multifunctional CCA addition/repair protein [Gammaproteobacteria bacterium]